MSHRETQRPSLHDSPCPQTKPSQGETQKPDAQTRSSSQGVSELQEFAHTPKSSVQVCPVAHNSLELTSST